MVRARAGRPAVRIDAPGQRLDRYPIGADDAHDPADEIRAALGRA